VAAAVVREAVAEDLAEGYRDMDARELAKLSEVVNLFTPQANCIMPLWFYHGLLG
jgi:malate dehydrogenase (decarboxylating)